MAEPESNTLSVFYPIGIGVSLYPVCLSANDSGFFTSLPSEDVIEIENRISSATSDAGTAREVTNQSNQRQRRKATKELTNESAS
jgi:hypothetical protein